MNNTLSTYKYPLIAGAVIGLAVGLTFALGQANDNGSPAPNAVASDDAAFGEKVRVYLMENPQVIVDALTVYKEQQQLLAEQELNNGVSGNIAALLSAENGAEIGKATDTAQIVVIEFFDYHCGYCKKASGLVQDLAKDDPAVKVIFRELPILRKESDLAARYALAAREQGKYAPYHFALMDAKGILNEKRLQDIAKTVGLDAEALEKSHGSDTIGADIEATRALAQAVGINGTPAFIIATVSGELIDVIPGYAEENVKQAIATAKKSIADAQ